MRKTMRKSALLSSIAMLIVSAIVLTSATYAWFSSSKVVEVKSLAAEVKVSTGLLISVQHGDDWGTSVDFKNADEVKSGWGAGYPEVFDPVSTADGNNWISAIYEDEALTVKEAIPGEDGTFVAVPLWITGPEMTKGAPTVVKATVDFTGTTANSATARCLKFALVRADETGEAAATGAYTEAVAATPNADNKFMGVSAAGETDTTENSAYVTDGGKDINELGLNDIEFTIDAGTSTDKPMMFIAYLWIEGNDADCKMLDFSVDGEDIGFKMNFSIVE